MPTESSSGARRAQGGITKTGNSHARRLLVESAWHHRKPYRPSRELIRRTGRPTTRGPRPRRAGKPPPAPTLGTPGRPRETPHDQRGRGRPRTRRLDLEPGRHGQLSHPPGLAGEGGSDRRVRGATRGTAMSSRTRSRVRRRSTLETRNAPDEHPVLPLPTRAHQSDRASITTASPLPLSPALKRLEQPRCHPPWAVPARPLDSRCPHIVSAVCTVRSVQVETTSSAAGTRENPRASQEDQLLHYSDSGRRAQDTGGPVGDRELPSPTAGSVVPVAAPGAAGVRAASRALCRWASGVCSSAGGTHVRRCGAAL